MNTSFDLAIVGSGGAAFAAAIRASELGKSVVMVERGTFGGTCVNTGCVPSKALLAAADARHAALDAGRFPGISATSPEVNGAALVDGKKDLVEELRSEKYLDVVDAFGWQARNGIGAFAGSAERPVLEVTSADGLVEVIAADQFLVATGAAPWIPPIPGLEGTGYLTSTTAMELTKIPESLLVLGGGYVAMEQAQLFARLGSKVTVVVRTRLASREEPEVHRTLQQVFADEGIRVVRRTVVTEIGRDPETGQIVATVNKSGGTQEFRADHVLVALGRRPVTEGLNLDAVGVETGPLGEVAVDYQLRSSNPRIWAAGDVTGHPEFVYVAAHHGAMVVDNAFSGAQRSVDYRRLPRVTFTGPAIGVVGLTEQQVLEAGVRCDCRVLPLTYVPRAIVNRDTRGFIKLVADADTGHILGMTAVARDAGELAAAGVHILGKTITEIADDWAPYLTMAEGIRIAAKSFTTDVTHLSCCA